jgi:hypothetical protein
MQEWIERINTEVFFFVNASMKHAINDIWLGYSTHLGNGWILFPIAALVLFVYERATFWKNLSYLALAGVIGGFLLTQAKLFFDAPRPLAVYHDQIQAGLIHINVMFEPLYCILISLGACTDGIYSCSCISIAMHKTKLAGESRALWLSRNCGDFTHICRRTLSCGCAGRCRNRNCNFTRGMVDISCRNR